MSKKTFINLHEHPDYVVAEGVGKTIVWHGQSYKTHEILPEVADRMAREPETKYINFSPARIAQETEARVSALVKPADATPAKQGDAQPAKTQPPAAKAEETVDKPGAAKTSGKAAGDK